MCVQSVKPQVHPELGCDVTRDDSRLAWMATRIGATATGIERKKAPDGVSGRETQRQGRSVRVSVFDVVPVELSGRCDQVASCRGVARTLRRWRG